MSLSLIEMQNILVPIDFSAVTPHVLEIARTLAKSLGGEIHLVHVKEIVPAVAPASVGYGVAGMPELMPMSTMPLIEPITPNEQDKAKLGDWQREIAAQGLKVKLHEPAGDVAEEILRTADAIKADMIVMGRHGHGAMYKLLVGSVTEGVLKRSNRPTLLVPAERT
jgi:nucleotide-binding universal stress UspA family protein